MAAGPGGGGPGHPDTFQQQAITRLKGSMQTCARAFQANLNDKGRLKESVGGYIPNITKLLNGQATGSRSHDFQPVLTSWKSFLVRYDNGDGNLQQASTFLQQANHLLQNIH